jgi:beta-galactosidase GanA
MGRWKVSVQFGLWQFGEPDWTWLKSDPNPTKGKPIGGALVVQLGPDEFLVSGSDARVRFGLDKPAAGENSMMARVEEGTFDATGRWVMRRVWNGDETDYGLNFTAEPVLLRVKLGTYR